MPYTPGVDFDGLPVTLGTLRLGSVDDAGVAWFLQKKDGWDSPEVRADLQERQADHGSWFSPVYLGSRPITLAGTIEAPSRAALQDAWDRMLVAASLTDTTLTVWESTPKQVTVRRSGKQLMEYVTDRTATWSVMVTAEDPRRYSTDLQSGTTGLPSTSGGLVFPVTPPITFSATTVSGSIGAVNSGTFETRPILTITGPVVAPVVSALYPDGTVRQLVYSQDLQAGDVLVIDTDAHSVTLNGNASRRRFMSVPSGWPSIPAMASVSYQFASGTYNSTAMLTAQWRSAWM
ncbi:MAG TPA: hypothetical protein VNC22_16235 [Sporichthya sp.]|nr:hypothetical protein [Sporichthya sp.]